MTTNQGKGTTGSARRYGCFVPAPPLVAAAEAKAQTGFGPTTHAPEPHFREPGPPFQEPGPPFQAPRRRRHTATLPRRLRPLEGRLPLSPGQGRGDRAFTTGDGAGPRRTGWRWSRGWRDPRRG